MRICIVGKFPPIQGGVSMRTYWTAHRLAARGHDVHVVTNAKEVMAAFRMHMRPDDWQRCEAVYEPGSVSVHWSDPVDLSQAYIPMASPFISKLAGIAARVHSERPFDLIYSHYMEPYGVAAYLAAQITGVPYVARMAGSDAGRLWRHPALEPLYDHVLRSASRVIAVGSVAERAVARGVVPERIASAGAFRVPEDLFTPDGPLLDIAALRREAESDDKLGDTVWGDIAPDWPYFGICGKLGASKGSFSLLRAMHRLARVGLKVGLVALAHGPPEVERRFRSEAIELGLANRVLQLPFLPHWRVPEFLRGCLAVCCLEQDFPIGFHAPIFPREALLSGACLVVSTELIRKLPAGGRLPDGYGCVAIPNVNDSDALAQRLAAIVRDPAPASSVGARGRAFARELQQAISCPDELEQLLESVCTGRPAISTVLASPEARAQGLIAGRFAFAELAARQLGLMDGSQQHPIDLVEARRILDALEGAVREGRAGSAGLVAALQIEIAIAEAEDQCEAGNEARDADPLFRLHTQRWALGPGEVASLTPVRDPSIRLLEFDFDVSAFIGVRTAAGLPALPAPTRSFMVAFRHQGGARRHPLVIDELTAIILRLSDGSRTVGELDAELRIISGVQATSHTDWFEALFVGGLISLRDPPGDRLRPGNAKGPRAAADAESRPIA